MSVLGRVHKFASNSLSQRALRSVFGKKTYDSLHPLGTQGVAALDLEKAAAQPATVIPLPDEDQLARIRRRRASQRGGGRDSTQLVDSSQTFGP